MVRIPSLPGVGAALTPALIVPAFAQGAPAAGPVTGLLAAALLLLAAGLFAVRKDPRDPAAPVIPRFRPPEGVSAALAAYLGDRSVTARVFAAAVAELAARGFVNVVGGPKPRIDRAPGPPETSPPLELRALLEALVPRRRPQIELGRENGETLLLARSELGRNLAKAAAPYLRPNGAAVGAVTVLASLALALAARLAYGHADAALLAGFFTLGYVFFGAQALQAAALGWERHRRVPGLARPRELARAGAGLLLVLLAALLGGLGLGLAAGAPAGALATALLLVAAWGARSLPALTREGAEAWRHLEGLARYLGTTDAAELRRIEAPEDTPETLRALYPYAVALGVESAFARRLERYLSVHPEEVQAAMLWDTTAESYPRMVGLYTYSLGVSRALHNAYQQAGAYTPELPGGR
ncbi:hypothetical protein Ocepr_0390 [Oceanithermus profundus DSM 14977]|uniref:Predicted membrane protein YciQ-like C-terminal domain-containing protein n=1 Tax=Oceanithermus profundus (strain DSM 14977 / NBRC 100410 / VKM B-2274 / 506) TaxID=670487 RepID=E4U629_OCEP5|nr:DUF2207 domain-containing protein [Oceanithermus profundus]ADR35850.1 hypothetical protein Ocepr_0390 [Oceanithermus profundus DSM 14977]